MKISYLDGTDIVGKIDNLTIKHPLWYVKIIRQELIQANLLLPPSLVFAANRDQSGWYILLPRK